MKKLSYNFVKLSFENEGYTLLTKEYINSQEYLEYICPNGHKHKIVWGAWQQRIRCGKCSGIEKYNYNFIKKSFEKEGYTLLTKDYKNVATFLHYICPNGHQHKIKWSHWQRGIRCGKCHYVTYNQVKQSFEKEGYTLLSKDYINNKRYLEYICPNGHKHKIKWNDWQRGVRCGKCSYIDGSSKQEKNIYNYVKTIYNGTVIKNDRTIIQNPKTGQYLELDIWLPVLRKAIEYNGKHWHSDKDTQWKDNYKQKWCKENNIDLLVINENKWIKNKDWNKIKFFVGG